MANNDDESLPTTDRRFPGRTVTLQPTRSYMVGPTRGPYARSLGPTTVKVLAEIERGGDGDLNGGR